MTQWEYLTLFLEAKVHKGDDERISRRFNPKKLAKNAPERLIPELDQLGETGWELIHMEPVAKVGGKGDVLFHGAPRWSSTYFCVFKRPKAGTVQSSAWTPAEQMQPAPATNLRPKAPFPSTSAEPGDDAPQG
ncbi:MAG: hypothetical protein K8J31_26615 [Anaerolineae bacterium]|nr:hypothetical protein [Anaerolineae bacterium]